MRRPKVSAVARRFWPGLGDCIVLGAFAVLVWLSARPFLHGRRAAGVEIRAAQTLYALRAESERCGILASLQAFFAKALALDALDVHTDWLGAAPDFEPTFEDEAYFYRVELVAAVGGGRPAVVVLRAEPRRPGSTGRVAFEIDSGGSIVTAPREGETGENGSQDAETMSANERRARERLTLLHGAWNDAGLGAALESFDPKLGRATALRPVATTSPPAPVWSDLEYLYRACATPSETSGSALVWYAWPVGDSSAGYAVFRFDQKGRLHQTRNVGRAYSGTLRAPPAGAGMQRPRTPTDARGGYTGYDGKRWFPVPAGN